MPAGDRGVHGVGTLAAELRRPRRRVPPRRGGAGVTATAEAGSAALETRDLRVEFRIKGGGVARAVDGVDLAVRRGEILALVGESGSGKTTLARTILGLQRPTAGTVHVDGEALSYRARDLKAYRRRAQLILQDPSGALNPRHTVYEAVAEGLRVHGLHDGEEAKVADALSRAGLRPPDRFYLRYPHELSGGQRQRVVIAGALVLDPDIIVADEPVSSLDASVRGEILALLLRLRDDLGLTLVVVTHDLGLAWNIADRVAVMYLGRILEMGPTEQIMSAPAHPYTKALLSVVPETEQLTPVVLAGETPDPTRIPAGCRFHTRCPALADGTAEAAGVDEQCRTVELPVLKADVDSDGHSSACHLVTADAGK
ncbi:ABC transporter ATP-binding protein [Mycolicibacterium moriokaense]|nr:ABC transporter ATP-binding protein [Mycolicibacterium moriokaense]